MKQVNTFKSFKLNPSYLGADRLWDYGYDKLSRRDVIVGDLINI